MKVLVLGAGGQVGRALLECAPASAEVVARDRRGCDIGDEGAVRRCLAETSPDLVFNAAAYTAVDRAESDPEEARRLNALAPGWIASACAAAGARLVHLSTDYVFDGRQSQPYCPSDATNPLGVYGRTKRDGERAVMAAAPDALVVRTAWLYGAAGNNFVRTMLRRMRERDPLKVVADQIGTPTHVESLAGALWRLAAMGAGGIHHYTDAGVASWYDFAVAIAEEALPRRLIARAPSIAPVASAEFPTIAPRPLFSLLDKSETWEALGGPPPHWRVNLRECLRAIAAHG